MMLSFEIQNPFESKDVSKEFRKGIHNGIEDGMKKIGAHMRRVIRADITKKSKGEMVTRYRPKRRRRVSLENFSPNNDLGKLRRSIGFDVVSYNHIMIGSSVKYAKYLEEGTKKMVKRPFIGVNIEREKNNLLDILSKSIANEVKNL